MNYDRKACDKYFKAYKKCKSAEVRFDRYNIPVMFGALRFVSCQPEYFIIRISYDWLLAFFFQNYARRGGKNRHEQSTTSSS